MKPDQYDIDDKLMDDLGGAMDDYDAKKIPVLTVEVCINTGAKPEPPKDEKPEDGMLPTPEEIDEMMKQAS